MTEESNPKQDIGYILLARIISVLVIALPVGWLVASFRAISAPME